MPRVSDLSSIRVGLEALRVNPLRTFLSTLGVVIGVAALVAVLSLGDGMESFARQEIARTTSVQDVFVAPRLADTVDGVPMPRQDFVRFGAADAASALGAVPGVAGVALSVSGTTLFTPPGEARPRAARATASLAGAAEFYGMKLAAGRFFTPAEVDGDAPVAVVSHALAAAVAPGAPETVVGRVVEFRGGPRRVVGVLPAREGDDAPAAFVPLTAAPAVLAASELERPRTLVLKARRVEEVEAVRAAAERWLAARFGDARGFGVFTQRQRSEQAEQGFLLFKLFLGAIAAISLLVGGIGIMNVLLASVTERMREIGIRKAVGARRRDIVLQFLSESVAISGSGSLVGLGVGLLGAFGITAAMRAATGAPVHAAVSASTLVVAAVSALVVGLSFGTYPALRAARLSPIDAIRHE